MVTSWKKKRKKIFFKKKSVFQRLLLFFFSYYSYADFIEDYEDYAGVIGGDNILSSLLLPVLRFISFFLSKIFYIVFEIIWINFWW